MTDETDDEAEEIEFFVEQPESRTEVYEWTAPNGKGGVYLFPTGAEQWCADNGVGLLHMDRVTGVITAQVHMGEAFRPIDKPVGDDRPKPTRLTVAK